MAIGCGAKCAKAMLIIFNIIFWLSGCAILAIGIWMLVDSSIVNTFDLVSVDAEDPLLKYATYILIAMGVIVFLVGFLGCCGAIKENKCMLGLYIFFLLLIMAGELAAGIVALLFKDEILGEASEVLTDKLRNDTFYKGVDDKGHVTFTPFGLAMSVSQVGLKCCGVNNYTDYSNFQQDYNITFPITCCVMKEGTKIADGISEENVVDSGKCYGLDNRFFHEKGCIVGLEEEFSEKALILIGLGIGVACIEIFGFIFAVCLCRNTGDDDEE